MAAKAEKSKLSAVPDASSGVENRQADPPKRKRKRSVATAMKAGDITRLELLTGIRQRLWQSANHADTHPRDLAALMKRLADVDHEIRTLEAPSGDQGDDGDADSDEGPAEDEEFDPASV